MISFSSCTWNYPCSTVLPWPFPQWLLFPSHGAIPPHTNPRSSSYSTRSVFRSHQAPYCWAYPRKSIHCYALFFRFWVFEFLQQKSLRERSGHPSRQFWIRVLMAPSWKLLLCFFQQFLPQSVCSIITMFWYCPNMRLLVSIWRAHATTRYPRIAASGPWDLLILSFLKAVYAAQFHQIEVSFY